MAAAHMVARQYLDPANGRHTPEVDAPEASYGRVIEDRARFLRGLEPDVVNAVIGRKLNTVASESESHGGFVTVTAQGLAR
jgi:hypothetical protein